MIKRHLIASSILVGFIALSQPASAFVLGGGGSQFQPAADDSALMIFAKANGGKAGHGEARGGGKGKSEGKGHGKGKGQGKAEGKSKAEGKGKGEGKGKAKGGGKARGKMLRNPR